MPLGAPRLRSLAILDGFGADDRYTAVGEFSAAAGLMVYADNGDIVISASQAGETTLFGMNGQAVKSVNYAEGETRITDLDVGAYIVAGRKVVLTK